MFRVVPAKMLKCSAIKRHFSVEQCWLNIILVYKKNTVIIITVYAILFECCMQKLLIQIWYISGSWVFTIFIPSFTVGAIMILADGRSRWQVRKMNTDNKCQYLWLLILAWSLSKLFFEIANKHNISLGKC